jgi:hypothetical protein
MDPHEPEEAAGGLTVQGPGSQVKVCGYVYGTSDPPIQCTSRVFRRGFCRRHGTTSRCQVEGCPKGSVVKGFCIAHARQQCGDEVMSDHYKNRKRAKCDSDGCPKYMQWKGFCIPHAREKYGDERVDEHFSRKGSACNSEGCTKRKVLNGYCAEHAREQIGGDEALEKHIQSKSQHLCTIKDCFERKAFNGLCFTHACDQYGNDIVNEHAKGKRPEITRKKQQVVPTVQAGLSDDVGLTQNGGPVSSPSDNMQVVGSGVKKASMLCKTDGCTKQRTFQGYCIAHARVEKGNDAVDEYMKNKSKARCRIADCQKRMHYKGHCIAHAREVFGDIPVDEHRRGKKAQQHQHQHQLHTV